MKSVAVIFAMLVLAGCDPESDMGQQPKYKPMAPSAAFADGASARPLVAGVVPRDPTDVPGNAYAHTPTTSPAGTVDRVDEATAMPVPIDAALISRGQEKFDIFCAACHGRLGNGQGMVARRGLMHPPSFHVGRLKAAGDGHFFNVISAGYGAMYSYADKVVPADRWAVIAYVRALQTADAEADARVADVLRGAGDARARTAGYRQ